MRKGIRVTVAGSKEVRKRATQALSGPRYAVSEVPQAELALERVRSEQPDVLVIQAEAARAALKKIRQASPRTRVITVHPAGGASHLATADTLAADDLVFAPVEGAELKVRVDRLVQAARVASAAARTSGAGKRPVEPSTELHDEESGRIDARRLAEYLDVPLTALSRAVGKGYKAVFKSPASAALQPLLTPVHRVIVALQRVYGDRAKVLAWLNSANLELGGARPIDLVLDGRAEAVADLVEATLAGVPT
jgi:DNA-binding NarL/FixJ family response regulator